MKNKDIVFITSKDDEHTDYMINYFNSNLPKISVIRLNTEDFATNCKITFNGSRVIIKILDSEKIIDSDNVNTVVYRRPKDINLEHIEDEYTREFMYKQFNAFLRGFYFCTHDTALWVNPLPSLHRARIKFQQLQLAEKIGLNIPKTMVSNVADEIRNFVEENLKLCIKSLDTPSFISNNYIYPLYTKIVEKSYLLKHIENIEVSPVFIQEYIEKKYDIRVVIIGNKIFAIEIHSQEHPDSTVDFRGAISEITHKIHQLPNDIEEKILQFVKSQQLHYSSMDLVLAQNNKYYFIENNPNGQWLWLEFDAKVDIMSHYANFLVNHTI